VEALALLLALASPAAYAGVAACPGDCDGDLVVTVDELVGGVAAALGEAGAFACPTFDGNGDDAVTVDEIVAAVHSALVGCPAEGSGCNGAEALCERRYDEVAYATAHNAMANADDDFQAPNQRYSITRQLEDGVRALMLDTYEYLDDVYLCHAECSFLGRRLLLDGLAEIRTFLERHPREVVSIIFEAYVSAEATADIFAETGLLPYVHTQPLDEAWPALGEMIDSDRRLVVFSDRDRGVVPWYHYVWDYAFETHFAYEEPADFSCAPNRGDPASSLFVLNHFLTRTVGAPRLAELVNHNPLFIDRARECMEANGRLPNFVTVDFYDIGDVLEVVRTLNGLDG
jgi:hypothetical protein